MVGSAFIVYWLILMYHFYKYIKKSRITVMQHILASCCWKQKVPEQPTDGLDPNEDSIPMSPPQPTVTVVELSQLAK